MEKSWENFWTTGKVEDYLSYRNCLAADEKEDKKHQDEAKENKQDTSWKGLM
ncbi:MAG: hypothetical protein IKJ16_03420 [Agathobacter sp.]|nr:hypothetical protein [Agathobacter sp.]